MTVKSWKQSEFGRRAIAALLASAALTMAVPTAQASDWLGQSHMVRAGLGGQF
jgi:hypothetical protein